VNILGQHIHKLLEARRQIGVQAERSRLIAVAEAVLLLI